MSEQQQDTPTKIDCTEDAKAEAMLAFADTAEMLKAIAATESKQPDTPTYRTLADGRVLVNVDGVEYIHNGSFFFANCPDTAKEVLQAFATSIRDYQPNGKPEEYKELRVDGMKCYYWAGAGEPTPMDLELYVEEVKQGKAVMRMETSKDGLNWPIFYKDSLQLVNASRRKDLTARLQACHRRELEQNGKSLGEAIADDLGRLERAKEYYKTYQLERECKQYLVYMIKEQGAKWPDLLEAVKRHRGLPQPSWKGGIYHSPENLAAAAVNEALELSDIMETEFNTSLRNIADWLGMPYTLLLDFYHQHYIINQESQPLGTKYIPYELWTKIEHE